jgi:hypothetical protein
MVGKRTINRSNSSGAVKESTYLRKDVEGGRPPQDRKYRFRDEGNLDPDDQRRVEFKRKLREAVDGSDLEGFRKSDDEVGLFFSYVTIGRGKAIDYGESGAD